MTTIATNGVTMAADGQAQVLDTILSTARRKIHRLSDGSLLGCTGRSAEGRMFREWLEKQGPRPKVKDFAALILRPDGSVEYWSELLEPTTPDLPCAIGSGMDFAIGAMEAGAEPADAIRIASKRDPFTGGEIMVVRL